MSARNATPRISVTPLLLGLLAAATALLAGCSSGDDDLQTFIAEMNSVMTILSQPLNDLQVHAHVCEESHRLLGCVNLFLGQPCRVFDCLLNIFAF